jgi:hypothetical protein
MIPIEDVTTKWHKQIGVAKSKRATRGRKRPAAQLWLQLLEGSL